MNQRLVRTLMFVGGAVVCLGVAVGMSIATRPVKLDDTALVGQSFYPDFTDPTKATGLRVAAYDKDAAKVSVFNVDFKDGLWRIPSHHNYPADGEEQLAKTAASVVGIERGLYAGKSAEDQKRLGVLDPLDDSITGTEGRGSRITLYQGGKPIVDLIVGNKAEESGNIYFVRKADDSRVYRAELAGLKVSTKFAEWIEPDLLQLDRNKLSQMVIDRYQVDEQKGSLAQGEVSVLTKEAGNPSAQWQLEGLEADKEKVKVATVSSMTAALDDLKIVGVREKPPGLVAVLTGQEGAELTDIDQLQMQRAGFFLTRGDSGAQLVSNEGEILAGTDEGIRYTLRFGEVLSGSELEIEVGADATDATGKKVESAEVQGAANAEGDEKQDDAENPESTDSSVKKNRYLFITAAFDETLLGERPAAPLKPVPPLEQPPAKGESQTPSEPATPPAESTSGTSVDEPATDPLDAAAEEAEGEASDAAADPAATDPAATDQPATEPAAEKPAATEQPATEPAATEQPATPAAGDATNPAAQPLAPDPQKVFEEAQKKYETDLAEYERTTKEFDKKVEDGEKRATELTERFAPWYYVISADLFAKLKVDRSALVEPPTPPGATPGAAGGAPPGLPFSLPSASDPATSPEAEPGSPAAEPATSSPAAGEAPAVDPAKPDDAPATTDEKPAAESSETEPPTPN